MKIKDVINALECFAPLPLQEDYDNAGLQVGLTEAEVSGVLLCLDVTEQVVDEAVERGCNMIVSHHPLIFRKLAQVTDANYVQRTVIKAIKNDVTIVSMHTNLDSAEGGVNYMIARKLGLDMSTVKLVDAHEVNGVQGGLGVVGEFPSWSCDTSHDTDGMAADDFIKMVKEVFHVECAMTNGLLRRPIKKVCLCGGAGAFLLPKAVAMGADAFLTGEMGYHAYFGYEQQIQICVIGHYESEQYTIELLEEILRSKSKASSGLRIEKTKIDTNPILYF